MDKRSEICVIAASEHDWIVREESGRELGHYPTRPEAEAVGRKLARKRGMQLVFADKGGTQRQLRPRKGWFGRLFGR
jgi:Uncharacterized protein conserved in bacteria (DUF2188)